MPLSLLDHADRLCASLCARLPEGDTRSHFERLLNELAQPLRVAVAGRTNAGKSTLVNSLLGQRVAPTGTSTRTRVTTWYRYGSPDRTEVEYRDGRRSHAGADPSALDVDLSKVAALHVQLSQRSLSRTVLIDTPGLSALDPAGGDGEDAVTDRDSREAAKNADALLFLLSPTVRADEAEFVASSRRLLSGQGAFAVRTVGVISKVDMLGGEDQEPWDRAAVLADAARHQLRSSVQQVVPLIGLLAETATTGSFTEHDAQALRSLASLQRDELRLLTRTPGRFVETDSPVPRSQRRRLFDLLGRYGILAACDALATRPMSANELNGLFLDRSGMRALTELLERTFLRHADVLKAGRLLRELDGFAGVAVGPAESDARSWLRDELERVELDASMGQLLAVRAAQAAGLLEEPLPEELVRSLDDLVTGSTGAEMFGLAPDASAAAIERACVERVRRWRSRANDPGRPIAEQRVAADACRAHEQIFQLIRSPA